MGFTPYSHNHMSPPHIAHEASKLTVPSTTQECTLASRPWIEGHITPFCSGTHMYTACLHDSELAIFNFLHHAIDVWMQCLCFECCATGSKKFGFLLLLQCTVCWCTIRGLWKCKYDVHVGEYMCIYPTSYTLYVGDIWLLCVHVWKNKWFKRKDA